MHIRTIGVVTEGPSSWESRSELWTGVLLAEAGEKRRSSVCPEPDKHALLLPHLHQLYHPNLRSRVQFLSTTFFCKVRPKLIITAKKFLQRELSPTALPYLVPKENENVINRAWQVIFEINNRAKFRKSNTSRPSTPPTWHKRPSILYESSTIQLNPLRRTT